jgi:hypothetical protein
VQVLDAALTAGASPTTFSERGGIVPELNDPAIREVLVFRCRLMYQVEAERLSRGSCIGRVILRLGGGSKISRSWARRLTSMDQTAR